MTAGCSVCFYMVEDKEILKENGNRMSGSIGRIRQKISCRLWETLQSYLKHNGSYSGCGSRIVYAPQYGAVPHGNIRKILGNELKNAGRETALSDCILYQKYAWADKYCAVMFFLVHSVAQSYNRSSFFYISKIVKKQSRQEGMDILQNQSMLM